jgi:ATP-dependent DNA ligase
MELAEDEGLAEGDTTRALRYLWRLFHGRRRVEVKASTVEAEQAHSFAWNEEVVHLPPVERVRVARALQIIADSAGALAAVLASGEMPERLAGGHPVPGNGASH